LGQPGLFFGGFAVAVSAIRFYSRGGSWPNPRLTRLQLFCFPSEAISHVFLLSLLTLTVCCVEIVGFIFAAAGSAVLPGFLAEQGAEPLALDLAFVCSEYV